MTPFRVLLAAMLLAAVSFSHAQVVVNEVHASNLNNFQDNYNRYEDWFELYNTSNDPVDLEGWWVSNRAGNPLKWQIPAGTIIPGNGHLVFVCSKRDEVSGGYLHTSFTLNQTDEDHVLLSDPNGDLVDSFSFVLLTRTKTGHSRIRYPDGGDWSLSNTPTPGAANNGEIEEYLERPVLLPAAGFYSGSQEVTITAADGVTIRYTLDGSEPTATSTEYTGPINVTQTTVIRAAAFGPPGSQSSFMETNTYFIDDFHTVDVLSISGNQLLTLLNGNGGIQPFGNLEYFSPTGILRDEAYGEFNEHGQDSWAYGQRGIDYIARDETGYNDGINYPIFNITDRDKFKRLIIKAAAGDNFNYGPGQPAHIRDMYVQALSQVAGLDLDERSYQPCVLYVNGQYWGVYDVREKVDDHAYTRYYYGQDRYDLQFIKTWGGTWNEYGGAQASTDWQALRNYIMNNDMGDPDNFAYVDGQLNWRSLVDYFVLNSYTVCSDWLNWNTGWWRGLNPDGEARKWRYILWDMDATFDHYANFTGIPNQTAQAPPCQAEQLSNPGGQGHTNILTKLMDENEEVRNFYVNRYSDLINTYFGCDFMLTFLDSLIGNIAPEMPGQIARWGGTMAEWENNVNIMRQFIEDRCVYMMQEGMQDCYDVEGPYELVFDVSPVGAGRIRINSITPEAYAYTGSYFGNIGNELAPIPNPGYTFSHWEVIGDNTITPSMTDSLVALGVVGPGTIIAHFVPEIFHDVVFNVSPPNGGLIRIGADIPATYPHYDSKPANVPIELAPIPSPGWYFSHWETTSGNTIAPSLVDSLVQLTLTVPDSIIAHFDPPQTFTVVLDMDPREGGDIIFDGVNYSNFPVEVSVQELTPYQFHVEPDQFYEWSHWEVRQHAYVPNDSTSMELTVTFLGPDTIIAHLIADEFFIEMPNTFTPNGDGMNDLFLPMGHAIDTENFEMEIFNRWGNSIYTTNSLSKGWNGTSNGQRVADGTYMYRVVVQNAITKEILTYQGYVAVYR